MQPVELKKYIDNGLILKNLSEGGLFDCVVYDIFKNDALEDTDTSKMIDLSQYAPKEDLGGKIRAIGKQHKKILLILTETPTSKILELLREETLQDMIIISTHHQSQQTDPVIVDLLNFPVYSPHDMVYFYNILENTSHGYIAIQPGPYPGKMIEDFPQEQEGHIYNCEKHGLTGPYGTILTTGRVTNEAIFATTKAQEEERMYDLFVATQRDWAINDALRDSLMKTEKLILIYDGNEKMIRQYAQSKLFSAGIYTVEVVVIAPNYSNVRTMHPEYLYQEAGFSAEQFLSALRE